MRTERGARVFLVFPSTHHAIAAEDRLRALGIPLQVMPPPLQAGPGCGLAIRLRLTDLSEVEAILGEAGILWQALPV